jgi:alpha-L-fucosidase
VTIHSLAKKSPHWPGEIGSVELLGAKVALKWTRDDAGLRVDLPASRPSANALVLRIGH